MEKLLKLLSVYFLLFGIVFGLVRVSYAEDVMVQVEQEMPVLRGDTWIKMNGDEKISFIWGAGHIVTIEDVLARENPELRKSNTFVNKIMEARGNKPMSMGEVAKHVDDFYQKNPDKLSTAVIEVIWYQTIVPRLKTAGSSGTSTN